MAEQFLSSRCDELESEVQELREQVEECMEWVHPATHDQRHDGLRVQRQHHHTDVAPADTEPY